MSNISLSIWSLKRDDNFSSILSVGDCDIVSAKDDKLFDDDIVIVVSDAYREKKRQEKRNKTKASTASSNSDPSFPWTSSGKFLIWDVLNVATWI